jgi:hypothetical protein
MSPRVQASKHQKRLRTPRIPFLLSRFDLVLIALTKRDYLFDQGFFNAKNSLHISALIVKRDFLFDQGFFHAKNNLHISALIVKRDSLFDQGFFITDSIRLIRLYRVVVSEITALKKIPLFHICFPASVNRCFFMGRLAC